MQYYSCSQGTMDSKAKKKGNDAPPNSYAVLFLVAAFSVFVGTVMVHKAMRYSGHSYLQGPMAIDWEGPGGDDDNDAVDDPEAADSCVPVRVSDDTRAADVLASMVDKSLDV